jgi:hypothetical protein
MAAADGHGGAGMVVENEGYQLFLCDTIDGGRVKFIPAAAAGWGMKLNEAGPITAGLPVAARETARLDLRTATTTVRQSLGIAYNGNILECGPIWGRKYDPDKEQLDLTAAGLWSIWDHRKALPGSFLGTGAVPSRAVWTISRGNLQSIARELVRNSIQENPVLGGIAGRLNIVLPASSSGTTHTRTYNGWDMAWIAQRLKELTEVTNGPDIRFRPRFMPGAEPVQVEWLMEMGTPLLQAPKDLQWDVSLRKAGNVHLSWDEDATNLAARAYILGPGQEKAKKIKHATDETLLAEGWPYTEIDESRDVESDALLQSHANALLKANKRPWLTWNLTVRADLPPLLGTYQPGDWAQLRIPEGHPQIPAGIVRVRILTITGGEDLKVKLTVAPIQGQY